MTTGRGRGFQKWGLATLDSILHRLRIPHRFWWRLCDAHDIALGVADTAENFPRRHGYYRLRHIASGASGFTDAVRCHHCQRPIDEWRMPCVLSPIPREPR